MNPVHLITRKRDGHGLTHEEIAFLIRGFVAGTIPEYQMSALAMAIFFRGMTDYETTALTHEMLKSGASLSWPDGPPLVDKHSTGGIGDKVSLILAPLLATCGLRVPMISGRGLGPTGGTLDKLEAIPGFRTNLETRELQDVVNRVGCAITSATSDLVPADRKLYALRDVTGTVPSIPLITASIMSKKLAESLNALVLDVKWGSGAFMKTRDDAEVLARSMVRVGTLMGVRTSALITDMNQPLGRMCGNAVEVQESLDCLRGAGPSDLRRVTLALGAELLVATNLEQLLEAGEQRLAKLLDSGAALEKLQQMIVAQQGDPDAPLEIARESVVESEEAGFVERIHTETLGMLIIDLGGGRRQLAEQIDHSVGIEMLVRIGDEVQRGQPLIRLFSRGPSEDVTNRMRRTIEISETRISEPELIAARLT